MRVVAGKLRGRIIEAPSAMTTRPTTDRVREALFSSLFSRTNIEGARVLDAFAGSGALGIEALSRGAENCLFFERDAAARKVLESNLITLGLSAPHARVMPCDVFEAFEHPLTDGCPFDIVLLDPPYDLDPYEIARLLVRLSGYGDLAPCTVISYEYAQRNAQIVSTCFSNVAMFTITGMKKYGKIGVVYLEYAQK